MSVRVWLAGPEDVEAIVGLSVILFREDAGSRDSSVNLGWPEDEGWEYFAGLVAGEGSVCLLAESSGVVMGTWLAVCGRGRACGR
jgi:hypothetical protein